jgi:hypothetical protein
VELYQQDFEWLDNAPGGWVMSSAYGMATDQARELHAVAERVSSEVLPSPAALASDNPEPAHSADGATAQEPWQRFERYVSIPEGVPDNAHRSGMRFHFMFRSPADASRIMSSLPDRLRSALPQPLDASWGEQAEGPDVAGKWTVWYEGVSLTVGEGKLLMNMVVEAGGEILEAFLT